MLPVRRAVFLLGALALALIVGACSAAGAGATLPTAGVPAALPLEVTVATAAVLSDEGAFVLDVREPDEFAAGHINGATLIPLGQLAARQGEVPRERTVLVVCRTGNRSAQGRDILLGAGYAAVTSMAGGMTEWLAQDEPIVTGS